MWLGRLVGIEEELWGRAGQGQAEARAPAGTALPAAAQLASPGPAALLRAVQPCTGRLDPTEAHGEPQTGSPAPASSPAAHWPVCLCWDWLPLPSPLEHPLSTGLLHGKVRLPLLVGTPGAHRLIHKTPHSAACPFLSPRSLSSDGSISVSSTPS